MTNKECCNSYDLNASEFDGLCSTIGTARKRLIDDSTLPDGAMFSRYTVKVRSLGTNTYIGIGAVSQNYRFTAAGQSHTWIAPTLNGSVIPLSIHGMNVIGDGATGVLEIKGIMIYRTKRV